MTHHGLLYKRVITCYKIQLIDEAQLLQSISIIIKAIQNLPIEVISSVKTSRVTCVNTRSSTPAPCPNLQEKPAPNVSTDHPIPLHPRLRHPYYCKEHTRDLSSRRGRLSNRPPFSPDSHPAVPAYVCSGITLLIIKD